MIKPWLLLARVTDRCNANCVYCMHSEIQTHPDMPWPLYRKIVDETASYVKEVQPIGYGEPLLYPSIVRAVQYATERGKRAVITTNASLLTPELSQQLLDAGLHEMRFSVEADTPKVFGHLRRPLSFHTVMENIARFIEIKNENGFKCRTIYCSCISPENINDVARITSYFKEVLGIDKGWWRRETRKPRPSDMAELYVPEHKARLLCRHVRQYLSVNWNGDVVLCCYDVYGKYVVGNVCEQDPLEIFNGERLNAIRDMFNNNGEMPKLCTRFCSHHVNRTAWCEKNY